MVLTAVILVVVLVVVFDHTNGFHDAANAIASAISTRALAPRATLTLAATGNLGGALLSTDIAATIANQVLDPPSGAAGLTVILAALVGRSPGTSSPGTSGCRPLPPRP